MRRKDLAAGATVFLVLVQLLFAQLTITITGCLLVVGKVSRWRQAWLAWPAVAGVAWVLADGLRPSLAGYLASGGHLVAHLARPRQPAIGLARLHDALVGWRRWLPKQLPLAVPAAVAEAALIGLAGRRDMRIRHRPGVLAGVRRAYLVWSTGRGELATVDGGCLGIAVSTGRRAAVSWQEAAGGVLCTGQDCASVTATGLALTLAAIAHRKAVLVIDLASGALEAGRAGPADVIESACANVGAPLRRFGGPHGCYDPLAGSASGLTGRSGAGEYGRSQRGVGVYGPGQRGAGAYGPEQRGVGAYGPEQRGAGAYGPGQRGAGAYGPEQRGAGAYGPGQGGAGAYGPGQRGADWGRADEPDLGHDDVARHVLAMIDWAGVGDERRRFCTEVVRAAVNVVATSAAAPDRSAPSVLDELLGLLRPGALGVRVRELPGEFGAAIELADRLDADPAAVAPVTMQLEALRSGALGRWLRRASEDSRISLRRALADREVVLFGLDAARNGRPAAMIARLALADLDAILAEFARLGDPADCLVWVNGCELIAPAQLRALVAVGASAGAAVLLGTAADSAAAALASEVNVVAIRGHAPPSLRADGWVPAGWAPGASASDAWPSDGRVSGEVSAGWAPGAGASAGWASDGRVSAGQASTGRTSGVQASPVWASSGRVGEMTALGQSAGSGSACPPGSGDAAARGRSAGAEPAYPPGSPEQAPLRMKEDPALPPWLTAGQHRDALSLLVRGPWLRALADCRAVR